MRGITALELDRRVTDTEPMRKSITDAGKHPIIDLGIGLDQVRAKRRFRGAQCPDMQIVHSGDASLRFQVFAYGCWINIRRNDVECHGH